MVAFIDYGNTANAVDLRNLPENLKNMPEMVAHCTLYKSNVGKPVNPLTEAQFKDLVDEGSPLHIQLIDIHAKPNVVRVFRDAALKEEIRVTNEDLTTFTSSNEVDDGLVLSSSPVVDKIVLPDDAPVIDGYLCWAVSSNSLYIQNKCRQDEADERVQSLLSAPAYGILPDPEVGNLCAAHFEDDHAYYRARILKVDDNGKSA